MCDEYCFIKGNIKLSFILLSCEEMDCLLKNKDCRVNTKVVSFSDFSECFETSIEWKLVRKYHNESYKNDIDVLLHTESQHMLIISTFTELGRNWHC